MTPIYDEWTRYEFTEQEYKEARIYTPLQKAYIATQIAEYTRERLELIIDPLNVAAFLQAEAELKGKIEALKFLINTAEDLPNATELQPIQD